MFQSPSGVLGVCRGYFKASQSEEAALFQSPSGVLGVCRRAMNVLYCRRRRVVSVPFRGFRGLQERRTDRKGTARVVSVPFRGFRGLQGAIIADGMRIYGCFSPLPGF